MLGTANVPKPVNIAPGTDGLSTGTRNPLGMPVAFLMSIGSLKKKLNILDVVTFRRIIYKFYRSRIIVRTIFYPMPRIMTPMTDIIWRHFAILSSSSNFDKTKINEMKK